METFTTPMLFSASMAAFIRIMLFAGGIHAIGFVIFHLFFWKIFQWNTELKKVSFINEQVMQIFNLCLIFIFMIIAGASFFFQTELVSSKLGLFILYSFSIFWLLRGVEQVIFFGLKKPLSIILTVVFFLGSAFFIIPAIIKSGS